MSLFVILSPYFWKFTLIESCSSSVCSGSSPNNENHFCLILWDSYICHLNSDMGLYVRCNSRVLQEKIEYNITSFTWFQDWRKGVTCNTCPKAPKSLLPAPPLPSSPLSSHPPTQAMRGHLIKMSILSFSVFHMHMGTLWTCIPAPCPCPPLLSPLLPSTYTGYEESSY